MNLLITFRRRLSGRTHQARFELGDASANHLAALDHAWNTNSEVLTVEEYA
jgi:hypothetical protein